MREIMKLTRLGEHLPCLLCKPVRCGTGLGAPARASSEAF